MDSPNLKVLPSANSSGWLGALAYGLSFLLVAGFCFYLRFGSDSPVAPSLAVGQSTVINGVTIKRIN